MKLFATLFLILILSLSSRTSSAQSLYGESSKPQTSESSIMDTPITIEFGQSDTTLYAQLYKFYQESPLSLNFLRHRFESIDSTEDSTKDSVLVDFSFKGIKRKNKRIHHFVLTELDNARQYPYLEPFDWIDFNRVDGFFLGIGSSTMNSIGRHDEIGVDGGFGYGFANAPHQHWQYFFDAEYRLPLGESRGGLITDREGDTLVSGRIIYTPPTLAIGGGFHNVTSTDDGWRASKGENAAYAFFAREDFRDYYKLAGWDAFLAIRPIRGNETRVTWRSDNYESRQQEVFYGRWGGNKRLPVNPAIDEGRLNSLVLTSQEETVHSRVAHIKNLVGDSVDVEQLVGKSDLTTIEFGHMPGTAYGFNRYTLDSRSFSRVVPGLSFDSRFRFDASTSDAPVQKLQYLGGPSSLPALDNKSLVGNRLLLLNTEVRVNLELFSAIFHSPDAQIIVLNDFGYIGNADPHVSIFKGFNSLKWNTIVYNVGVGIGWVSGIQTGVEWRTDVHASPKFFFRLERPF